MNSFTIHSSIKNIFYSHYGYNVPVKYQGILSSLDHIIRFQNNDERVLLTKVKVILEGVYLALPDNSELKHSMNKIRSDVWVVNSGKPTADFMISNQEQLHQTKNSVADAYWTAFNHNEYSMSLSNLWHLNKEPTQN